MKNAIICATFITLANALQAAAADTTLAASGQASWYEFAQAVFAAVGADPARVSPTDSSAFVRPAPRPAYSVLGHDAWATAGLAPMRDWREAFEAATQHGVVTAP
jgi:dTDP-4-dehydrorhamnose reductase